jgi:hypothetical protein
MHPLRGTQQKTDVVERPRVFDHIGLLVNGRPDRVANYPVIRPRPRD